MSPDPSGGGDPRPVTVVGPGRLGQSLALALASAGLPVELRGRSGRAPDAVSGSAGIRYRTGVSSSPSPTLVFAVPDDALAAAARSWAGAADGGAPDPDAPAGPGPVALHTSGVHPADALSPLRGAGYRAGLWHPLTAVAAPARDAFRGVPFGLQGDPPAVERGRELAARVGGRGLSVAPGEHARYHAAAVFASNHLAACLGLAAEELARATDGEGGLSDLVPLARAALRQVAERGLPGGVTGPVARGDAGTVSRHLEALPPHRRELYRGLARELLGVVEDRVPPGRAEALRRALLDSSPSDPEGGAT